MRRPLIAVLVAMSILAAGCASSTPPAWTYAPPTPEPTPGPSASAGASGAPSASGPVASAVASAGASGAPAASGAAGAPVVIEALNIEFTTPNVNGPASVPFQIEFRNGDGGTLHNVDIKDSGGTSVFKGDFTTGVVVTTYNVPALAPGTYSFVCDVHPTMTGTLKVGG